MNYWNRNLGAVALSDSYVSLITDVASGDEPLANDDGVLSKIDLGSPEDSAERAFVDGVFVAARKAVEAIIHRPIGTQTFEYGMTGFPCGGYVIELPKAPMQSLLSVAYRKDDGTTVTLYEAASPVVEPTTFVIETGCQPGALFLKSGNSWPTDILMNGFPVKIRFTAGIDPVPADLLQYLRLIFGFFYENRELAPDAGTVRANLPNVETWLRTNYGYDVFA
jgi:hypothetical protein